MLRPRIRVLLITSLGILAVGCKKSCECNLARANQNAPLLAIREMVYEDGWKQCGLAIILTNGSYTWSCQDIWTPDTPSPIIVHGCLPSSINESLASFVRNHNDELKSTNSVATYVHYVDGTWPKPWPIQALLDYLYATRPIDDASTKSLRAHDEYGRFTAVHFNIEPQNIVAGCGKKKTPSGNVSFQDGIDIATVPVRFRLVNCFGDPVTNAVAETGRAAIAFEKIFNPVGTSYHPTFWIWTDVPDADGMISCDHIRPGYWISLTVPWQTEEVYLVEDSHTNRVDRGLGRRIDAEGNEHYLFHMSKHSLQVGKDIPLPP